VVRAIIMAHVEAKAKGVPNCFCDHALLQVNAVMQRVEAVAKGVPEQQLKQAKQLAISSYKDKLASSTGMVAAMAPHLLLSGRFEPSEFAAKVRACVCMLMGTVDVVLGVQQPHFKPLCARALC